MVAFKMVHIWDQRRREYMSDYDVQKISSMTNAQSVFAHLVRSQQLRVSACAVFVRRLVLTDNNIFFISGLISEDVFWTLQLWQHAQAVKVVNLNFYGYYHRGESITTSPSIRVARSYDTIFTHWSEQCKDGCVNAAAILEFMSGLWINRGYSYYKLQKNDKPEALGILKRHKDLLNYAATAKSRRVAKMVKVLGVKCTVVILGWYWQLRNRIKR
jgi:hypothetical protein